jgi:prepilin-type N-terminal cleavage/methylation domain-containing protein
MNINQMKEAIKKFRAADFSGIKDEELRAKAQKLQAKQGGFTLLELLVVISLLAALATAALIAYDGVGDKAQATAAADANMKLDNAIRQYKATSNSYPNQWDNLVAEDGSLIDAAPVALANIVQPLVTGAADGNIIRSLGRAGINELQHWSVNTAASNTPGVIPNLAHNESFNPGNAEELEHWEEGEIEDPITNIAVVPTQTGCTASTVALPATTEGPSGEPTDPLIGTNWIQNRYSDFLEQDECHLVVALGFGSDAAASTTASTVSIGKAPSFAKTDSANPENNIDPNRHYSRFIGLFLVGSDSNEDGDIADNEYLDKARLIAVIAPDGTIADQNQAAAVAN